MKNQLLTLSILATALNTSHTIATEIKNSSDELEIKLEENPFNNQFSVIPDLQLRKELLSTIETLVFISNGEGSSDLEETLIQLHRQIMILEEKFYHLSSCVKDEILSMLLRSGVVVLDVEKSRGDFEFNESIVTKLENRQWILNTMSSGGTICI
jgi:hypothetical protein